MKRFTIKYWLILFGLFAIGLILTPLEYDSIKFKTFIYPTIWIAMAFLGIKLYRQQNSAIASIFISIGGIIYLLMTCWFALGFLLCAWTRTLPLYSSRIDSSVTIVCRHYECYGTDSDCELFKEQRLSHHLKWVTKFNETPVDTTVWQKIPLESK